MATSPPGRRVTSWLMTLTLLLSLVAYVSGYTDPTISPQTVSDTYGNSADADSQITWGPLPEGEAYKYSGPPADNPWVSGFLAMVRGFTHFLQPAPLPYDMLSGFIDGTTDIMANIKDLAFYFAGFAVCIVIGFLFMLIMPIVCCCFCCCRMCGKCGGKRVRPNPDKNEKCRCVTFSILLFITTANIATAASLVYLMDDRLSSSIDHMATSTGNNMDDVVIFLNNMVEELSYTAEKGFLFAGDVVKRDLDNIDAIFGVGVKEEFNARAGVDAAVQSIIDMDDSMDQTEVDMSAVNSSQVAFEASLDALNVLLTAVDTELTDIKTNAGCRTSCQGVDQTLLVPGVDKANLPSIVANLITIRGLQAQDLTQSAKDGKKDFDEIPEKIANDTEQNVEDLKQMIDDFQTTLSDSLSQMDELTAQTSTIEDQKDMLTSYTGMLGDFNSPISYGFLGLSCFIWFICVFFLIGLVLGCCGFKAGDPTDRSKASNCGGCLLMAGVGFCFIFSTVFMILVTLPFMIGAPLDRFLCEPLMDPEMEIFKEMLDKPDGPLGEGYFLGGMLLQDSKIPLTISGVLGACKNDTAAYQALSLEHLFNITAVTDYKSEMDIESELANMDSDMSDIEVMSDETRQILLDFKDALNIDYNAYQTELSKTIGAASFRALATSLRDAAADGTNTPPIETRLNTQADELDRIADDEVPPVELLQNELLDDVNTLEASSSDLPDAIDKVIETTEATEEFIQVNGTHVVSDEAREYGNRILGTIDQFVDFFLSKLKGEIGGCLPLWNIWESLIHDSLCNGMILTLNGVWFGLGWSIFFMVLSIIFGVRLAKYLRKMNPDTEGNKVHPTTEGQNNDQGPTIISEPPPAYRKAPPPQPKFAAGEKW